MTRKPAVLFVCLGNIGRSPLAAAAFRAEAARLNLDVEVDSAGLGDWHVGEAPDMRAQEVARRHGIDISGYRARQVRREDFGRFTHIIAMDRQNISALKRLRPAGATAELSLLLDHVEGRAGLPVTDPWDGPAAGFETTWSDVAAGAEALARKMAGLA